MRHERNDESSFCSKERLHVSVTENHVQKGAVVDQHAHTLHHHMSIKTNSHAVLLEQVLTESIFFFHDGVPLLSEHLNTLFIIPIVIIEPDGEVKQRF